MAVVDPLTGLVLDSNQTMVKLYGGESRSLIGHGLGGIAAMTEAEEDLWISEALETPGLVRELPMLAGESEPRQVSVASYPFHDNAVTQLLLVLAPLSSPLAKARERESILANEGLELRRELDHRVRNNLQFLHSLISLERRRDPQDLHARELERLEGFVGMMAKVYESAMGTMRGGFIETRELFDLLLESEGLGAALDRPSSHIEANLSLRLDQAISIGLLFKLMLFSAVDCLGKGTPAVFRIRGRSRADIAELEIEGNVVARPNAEDGEELLTKAAAAQISATLTITQTPDKASTIYSLRFPLFTILPLV